jgi:DNA (cytosine-5)-methyltransferase 1
LRHELQTPEHRPLRRSVHQQQFYLTMKVLNLYAGIGGNRKLWQDVEVTAVEYNEEIAAIYKEYFPDDAVVVGDAHEYLLKHYREFDFIWSSPPCQTHSRARFWGSVGDGKIKPKYPDAKLWQEIIFGQYFIKSKWVIENVKPYYEPFLKPDTEIGRHLFWSNFRINANFHCEDADINRGNIDSYQALHGFDIKGRKINHRKDQILRNCVNPSLGLYILEQAQGIIRQEKTNQISLFNNNAA